MTTYNINPVNAIAGMIPATLFKVSFGTPANGDEIVKEVDARMKELSDLEGKLAVINGPATNLVCMTLAHHVAHRFGAIAGFDPKMSSFVVTISHDPEFPVGHKIALTDVKEV